MHPGDFAHARSDLICTRYTPQEQHPHRGELCHCRRAYFRNKTWQQHMAGDVNGWHACRDLPEAAPPPREASPSTPHPCSSLATPACTTWRPCPGWASAAATPPARPATSSLRYTSQHKIHTCTNHPVSVTAVAPCRAHTMPGSRYTSLYDKHSGPPCKCQRRRRHHVGKAASQTLEGLMVRNSSFKSSSSSAIPI